MISPDVMATLAFWRNVSFIFLSVFIIAAMLVPVVLVFFAQKYVRLARHKLAMPMLYGQLWALRIENTTLRAADRVVSVPISVQQGATRLRATAEALRHRRG